MDAMYPWFLTSEWVVIQDVCSWVSPCHDCRSLGFDLKPRIRSLMRWYHARMIGASYVNAATCNEGDGFSSLLPSM